MKNKFVLTEEESKRILSLHKKKIQEEREEVDNLDEDDGQDVGQSTGRIMAGTAAGAATGAGIGAIFGGIGAVPGSIIGAGVGALAGWMTTGGGYSERVLKLVKFCKAQRNNLGKPVNSVSKLNDIADNIRGHVEGVGRTEEVLIARDLRALKTIPDFCGMIRIYSQRYNENWYNAIDGDIDMDTEWRDFVWLPLSELAKNTKKQDGGKAKGKCAKIINYYIGNGYKKITVERYRELANDKTRKRAYKFCPETKENLFFAKYIGGNNNGGDDGGDGGDGGGGGRGVTYPFDYNTILAAINQKCKGGGGGGDTGTPEDTDVINPFGQGSEEKQVITVTDKVYTAL